MIKYIHTYNCMNTQIQMYACAIKITRIFVIFTKYK